MLVWLDSFELLAPRIQEPSQTLTEFPAATHDPLNVGNRPAMPAAEAPAAPAPTRRRRAKARPPGEAPG
jgi:hypothetical protein